MLANVWTRTIILAHIENYDANRSEAVGTQRRLQISKIHNDCSKITPMPNNDDSHSRIPHYVRIRSNCCNRPGDTYSAKHFWLVGRCPYLFGRYHRVGCVILLRLRFIGVPNPFRVSDGLLPEHRANQTHTGTCPYT